MIVDVGLFINNNKEILIGLIILAFISVIVGLAILNYFVKWQVINKSSAKEADIKRLHDELDEIMESGNTKGVNAFFIY